MGYDMHWHRPPAEDSPAYREYVARRNEAHEFATAVGRQRTEREQAEVERLFNLADEAHYWYFRLNIWGMGAARDALVPVGVVRTEYDELPEWPSPGDYGVPEESFDEDDAPKEWHDYLAAADAVRAWVPPGDGHGVAIHKLGSNDGWHVTPGEITTGVGWADAHHDGWRDRLEPYIRAFVEWMERAAREGEGYHVY